MGNRSNTFFGWVLFSGIVALGLSSLSSRLFEADKSHRPEVMGYEIEGVAAEGGAAEEPFANLLAKADIAKGEQLFKKCTSCHTINQGGANGIGPNLYGVMGEAIAAGRGGFAFSDALKSHGGSWDFENMNAWLANPKKFAAGTKMTFAGLSSAQDRADLALYMNAQGSNLPLPAPVAVPEGGAAAAGPAGVEALLATADVAKGEQVYKKCTSCHTINQGGANGIGPNLYGIVGEAIASGRGGFAFSDGLKSHGGTWDFASLDAWLANPKKFAAGTKMTFAGLGKPEDRANLIAYLNAQGSNVPLPAAGAAAPGEPAKK